MGLGWSPPQRVPQGRAEMHQWGLGSVGSAQDADSWEAPWQGAHSLARVRGTMPSLALQQEAG